MNYKKKYFKYKNKYLSLKKTLRGGAFKCNPTEVQLKKFCEEVKSERGPNIFEDINKCLDKCSQQRKELIPKKLIRAVKSGIISAVKSAIEKTVNINGTDKYGKSVMHYVKNNVDIAKILLENGAKLSIKDKDEYTPLYIAVLNGNHEMTKFLLNNGANVNATDSKMYTPLIWAVYKNREEIVELLINNGADVNATDKYGQSAMHSVDNNTRIAKFLVDNGAKLSIQDDDGNTPLHIAVKRRNFEMTKFLLENGANGSIKNKRGFTPYIDLWGKFRDLFWEYGYYLESDYDQYIGHLYDKVFTLLKYKYFDMCFNEEYELSYPFKDEIEENVNEMEKNINICNKNYLFFSLNITDGESEHQNIIFINKKDETAERFEPYGRKIDFYDDVLLDDFLWKFFENLKYRYSAPIEYCPTRGPQTRMENDTNMCVAWSWWYIDSRLENPDINPHTFITDRMNDIEKNKGGYDQFINKLGKAIKLITESPFKVKIFELARLYPKHNIIQNYVKMHSSSDDEKIRTYIKLGSLENLKTLINSDNINKRLKIKGKETGRTALTYAIQSENLKIIKFLLQRGADVSYLDLIFARFNTNLEIVELLLKHGTDTNESPLNIAISLGNNIIAEYLLEHDADINESALNNAYEKGDLTIGKLLLNHGALFIAIPIGNLGIIKFLLNSGANVQTALTVAIEKEKVDIIKLLIDNGADVNFHDSDQYPPLVSAIFVKNLEIIKLLLDNGADVNEEVLNIAIDEKSLEIIRLLLDNVDASILDKMNLRELVPKTG